MEVNSQINKIFSVSERLEYGKVFKVNPLQILDNRGLFLDKRCDWLQEQTRILILRALDVLVNHFNTKYRDEFYILIPKIEWVYQDKKWKTIQDFEKLAKNIGGQISNWISEPLAWAQYIVNGNSWYTICNIADLVGLYRLCYWGDEEYKFVGGASKIGVDFPISYVQQLGYFSYSLMYSDQVVPSIVIKSLDFLF